MARAFNQVEHAGLLAPYAEAYFTRLPEIWAAHSRAGARMIGGALFPYPSASPELLLRSTRSWPSLI